MAFAAVHLSVRASSLAMAGEPTIVPHELVIPPNPPESPLSDDPVSTDPDDEPPSPDPEPLDDDTAGDPEEDDELAPDEEPDAIIEAPPSASSPTPPDPDPRALVCEPQAAANTTPSVATRNDPMPLN